MKYYFILSAFIICICYACESNNPKTSKNGKPFNKEQYALLLSNNCKNCHALNEKIQGPSYADIATKYANDSLATKYLIGKIIKGGSGVWGPIVMPAHEQISEEDAAKMVQFILDQKPE
jgi:cytochrome c